MKQYIEIPKNKEELFPLVEEEIELIKKNFSQEEIGKLENAIIDPNQKESCIYGLMTGTCNSHRVNSFIKENLNILVKSGKLEDLNNFKEYDRSYYYMTPLESYIFDDEMEDDEYISSEAQERINKVIDLLLN